MAVKYLIDLDLSANELQNAVIQNLGTAPAGVAGRIYYDTGANEIRYFDGTSWAPIGVVYSPDGTTLNLTGTTFSVANGGIGTAQLATDAVTAPKLSGISDGNSGQLLTSNGEGGFAWANAVDEDVNTTNLASRLTQLSSPTIGDGTGSISINGNLLVSGTTTTIDTTELSVTDNIITLNAGATSGLNAGIEVNRGIAQFVPAVRWHDLNARWQFTNDGTNYYDIPLPSQYAPGDITRVIAGEGITGGGTSGTVTVTNEYIRKILSFTGAGGYSDAPIDLFVPESVECTVKEVTGSESFQMVITDWYVDLNTGTLKVYLQDGVDYWVTIGGIRQ